MTAVFRQDTDVLAKNCIAGDDAREGWIFRPFLLVTFLWASKEKLPGRRRRTEALLLRKSERRDRPASSK